MVDILARALSVYDLMTLDFLLHDVIVECIGILIRQVVRQGTSLRLDHVTLAWCAGVMEPVSMTANIFVQDLFVARCRILLLDQSLGG